MRPIKKETLAQVFSCEFCKRNPTKYLNENGRYISMNTDKNNVK